MTGVLTEHEKLAMWSAAVSVHVRVPTVAPNLRVGDVRVDGGSVRGEPLRYHVTDGTGLPPVDVQFN